MARPIGYKASAETRDKIRKKMIGRKFSPETISKMRASQLGRKMSKESIEKKSGKNHPRWNGGRKRTREGYIYLLCPDHPFANSSGRVLEHRLVMETHIGRTLLPTEVVHHINGIRDDNRIENLMLFSNTEEHSRHHGGRPR